jgi:hypothetical protein
VGITYTEKCPKCEAPRNPFIGKAERRMTTIPKSLGGGHCGQTAKIVAVESSETRLPC